MRIGRESCCLGGHEPPINGEGNGGQARKSFLFTRRSLEAAGKPRLLLLRDELVLQKVLEAVLGSEFLNSC